ADWSFLYATYVGNAIPDLAQRLTQPGMSVDALRTALTVADICGFCDRTREISAAFTLEHRTGEFKFSGDPVDERLGTRILENIRAGRIEQFHASVLGGLYFVDIEGIVTTALVFVPLNADRSPGRIAGVVIDPMTSREMMEFAFRR